MFLIYPVVLFISRILISSVSLFIDFQHLASLPPGQATLKVVRIQKELNEYIFMQSFRNLQSFHCLSCLLLELIDVMFQVYQDGINNIRVGYILRHLAFPAVSLLVAILAAPYIFANGLLPLAGRKCLVTMILQQD